MLHLAVVRRDDQTIRRLLAAKANPNCQAHRKGICPGPSIMASACKSGQLGIIQALLAAGAVVDASSKVNSLAWEELQELREFQGVSMGDALNMDGSGVLHVAGQSLQLMEAVMPLMSEGELHEAAARRDENGVTPLMIAASMAADDSEAMGAVKELLPLSGEHGGCRVQGRKV